MEYEISTRSPHLIKDINAIERVQRNFTRRVFIRANIPLLDYADRLKKRLKMLGLELLEIRRIYCDLFLDYNIFHRLCFNSLAEFSVLHQINYPMRGHNFKLSLFRQ